MIDRIVLHALPVLLAAGISQADPRRTAILPPEQAWSGKSLERIAAHDDRWVTPAERSGFADTPRYEETMAWLRELTAAAPELALVSIGTSAEGREIRMVVASREGARDPAGLRRNGRPTLLAHGGIHPGEIDGKDAGMMLLRDLTVARKSPELLERANLLFIPILSVDGHERFSPFGRLNQRGPAAGGWRTNGRNLNLNRDFAKLETEEVAALVQAILAWRPDLHIDLHVTDGADYQYDVTYGYNGAHGWSPSIVGWLDSKLRPAVDRDLTDAGHVPGPLIFAANGRDFAGGNVDWMAGPRFSNGWGDARHLPTILVENHSLKSYRRRVLGTHVFLESVLRLLGREPASLREAIAADRGRTPDEIVVDWSRSENPTEMKLRGVRSEPYDSDISGRAEVRWTGEPEQRTVQVHHWNRPTASVRRPAAYYLPAAWHPIATKLRLQGIEVLPLSAPTTIEVERYRLPDAAPSSDRCPYEGLCRIDPGRAEVERATIELSAGSFRIETAQPLGTLAVLLLEPASPDSYFQWGYFASILQRTEYAEGYVIEPMARAMLAADPELRAAFDEKLESDSEFAGDANARLDWFYRRTPFYDRSYRLYPVARSID